MSLVFPVAAVVVAAACGWPASALIAAYTTPRTWPGSAWLTGLTGLTAAALVLVVTLRLHQILAASAVGWLILCGVPLAVIDSQVRRLPDLLTGACFAGVAVLLTAAAAASGHWQDLARAGAGAAIVALLFALLALVRPGSAGLGDAKLGLSTGAVAGWAGWGVLLGSVFAAFVLAAVYGLVLLAARRASLRSSLPFGPFLLVGCLAAVILAGS